MGINSNSWDSILNYRYGEYSLLFEFGHSWLENGHIGLNKF